MSIMKTTKQQIQLISKVLAIWFLSIAVLMIDQFSIDSALIVTLLVANLGWTLNNSNKTTKLEEYYNFLSDDIKSINEDIKELKNAINSLNVTIQELKDKL